LLQKAQRNLEAVRTAVKEPDKNVPHATDIISALWLRSLSVERLNGAEPAQLHSDVTRSTAVDDNAFLAEMALIRENSFNIHPVGNRLVFKEDENAEGKLLAHARNDKLFEAAQDIDQLANEIRYAIGGSEEVSRNFRVVVLRRQWLTNPWSELPENQHPDRWDGRLTLVVLPEYPDTAEAVLGKWLKQHVPQKRNTIRFLLPKKTASNVYFDRDLIVYARAVFLASQWKETDPAYKPLFVTYQNSHLRPRLRELFDAFGILDVWNFAQTDQCRFIIEKHGAIGDKIPNAVDTKIQNELFIAEDFEAAAIAHATSSSSLAKFISDLEEPAIDGKHCIPWLGEVAVKERVLRLCAAGKLAINYRGLEYLQAEPGETEDACWTRIKGKIGSGRELEQTTLLLPGAIPYSGGAAPPPISPPVVQPPAVSPPIVQPPAVPPPVPPVGPSKKPYGTPAKSPINLLGEVEKWGISPATNVSNVNINVGEMTGAQLIELLKKLPDGVSYALNLDKEAK